MTEHIATLPCANLPRTNRFDKAHAPHSGEQGAQGGSAAVEKASAANLKRTWVNNGLARDWTSALEGEGREFLRHATEVKNIWTPYGE